MLLCFDSISRSRWFEPHPRLCCVLEQDINPCIVLVQPRKTHSDMTEKLFAGTPNKFALIVFLVSLDCECFVALPYGAVGFSTLYDCGISCSCVLIYFLGAFPSPK